MFQMPVSKEIARIRRIALGDLVYRSAIRFGSRLAVVDRDIRMSYSEVDAASSQFAHYLLKTFPRGAHVAMLCANSADMLVAINGIHKAGSVWVPVNMMLGKAQLDYIIRHAESSCLVIDEEIAQQADIAALLAELKLPVILTRATGASSSLGTTFVQALAGQARTMPDIEIDSNQPALIMYTSGTTGNPKGVVHSHASAHHGGFANVVSFGFTEKDVLSCMLPLFHIGQHCVTLSAAIIGACVVMFRGFRADEVINDIQREKITVTVGLPMMYAGILNNPLAETADFSSLRMCVYAMAPMPAPLVGKIAAKMSKTIMLATGQTEIYPITMSFRPMDNPGREANYWGVSTSACETAIMDDEGNLLPRGQVGEIVHRGPNTMLGYYKDETATAAAQLFGWHHTGDLGMFDDGDQLLFLDRKKDMIKTGGENVPSIKVESAIWAHPAVAGVAVIGVPHPHWSEAICAMIVLKAGAACTEAEMEAHCKTLLGRFEVPKVFKFVDALPMTATGKMQKQILRKQFSSMFTEA